MEKNESRIKKTEQSRLKTGMGEPLHQKKKKRNKSNYKLFFFTGKKLRLAPMRHWSRSNYKGGEKHTHTCPNLYLDQGRVATCHNYIKPSQVIATGLFMK